MATDTPIFVSGLRGTEAFAANERPKNFREAILWLDPNGMAPLTALSSKMRTESTDDPEFHWWEERLGPKRVKISAGAQTTTLTLVSTGTGGELASPAYMYKVGDILQIASTAAATQPAAPAGGTAGYGGATGVVEIVAVTAIPSATTLTVTRSVAGAGAGAGSALNVVTGLNESNATHSVTLIGSRWEEGAGAPDTRTSNPTETYNYTQIFKTAFGQTNTSMATKYRTGDAFKNDQKRAMFTHSEQLEQASIWGVRTQTTGSGGQPARTMNGLRAMLTSNVNILGANITNTFFLDTLTPLFDFNAGGAGDQRVCFLGNSALNAIQRMIVGSSGFQMKYEGEVTFYGLNLLKYRTPQGTFFLKTHPLFNQDPVYTKSMLVINGKGIIRRPIKGRDTKIQTNIQANDADMRKDQWLTEMGLEVQFERTMGYYGNISYT